MSAKTPSADAIASTNHASPVSARRETRFNLHTPLGSCSTLRAFCFIGVRPALENQSQRKL
jgi:hypothetical protein